MATLWFSPDRVTKKLVVARFASTESDYARVAGNITPSSWIRLDFDADTNPELCHDLLTSTDLYSLSDRKELIKKGKAVVINPPALDSMLAPILLNTSEKKAPNTEEAIAWLLRRAQRGRV